MHPLTLPLIIPLTETSNAYPHICLHIPTNSHCPIYFSISSAGRVSLHFYIAVFAIVAGKWAKSKLLTSPLYL